MKRRDFLLTHAAAGVAVGLPAIARAARRDIVLAEPVHSIGYLPMYIATAKGYFAESDINASVLTVESGAGHTNAVLSGQAFAFIGGPEHNAFAKAKGAELRAVVHCVDRGNVYLCAAKGHEPTGTDWSRYVKGKTIATGFFGSTPNSITRYLLDTWKLDAQRDVTLIETPNSAVPAAVKSGRAQIGVTTEPMVTQGVRQGFWAEPFYNVPKELGPYAYSTLNLRFDTMKKDPELVRGFVRAIAKSLKFTYENPAEAAEIAKKEFPTMPLADLKATLDRSFADEMWSHDGQISRQAWTTASKVVRDVGILKSDVAYDQIIDMSFVDSLRGKV
jgi:NitT/TauT family transport system substrate-binding protein